MMQRWATAFFISLGITIGIFVLVSIAGNLSEGSIMGRLFGYVALIPYAPISFILNLLFHGPDHTGIVFIVAVVLMLLFYTVATWLVLTFRDVKRRRRLPSATEA